MSFSRLKIAFWISVFISSTKLVFESKELLNFQRPRPLEILLKGTLLSKTVFVNWKPFQRYEKCFYFTLKALYVLNIFNFFLDFLVIQKSRLIRKIRLIAKFLTSQPGLQTIAIHILINISRSKRSQAMKFSQLI